MAEHKMGTEELSKFRSNLQDILVIAEGLSKHCTSVNDFIDMVKLADSNDGQLKLLMTTILGNISKR